MNDFIDFSEQLVYTWYADLSKQHKYSLQTLRYFPKPYFGNPRSKQLRAVFLNLNPGPAHDYQDIENPDAAFIQEYKRQSFSYRKTIKSLMKNTEPWSKTVQWWTDKRLSWARESFGEELTFSQMIGLELNPWHSTKYHQVEALGSEAYQNKVIATAIALAKKMKQPLATKDGKPIVFCKGAPIRDFLVKRASGPSSIQGGYKFYSIEKEGVWFVICVGNRGMDLPLWQARFAQ